MRHSTKLIIANLVIIAVWFLAYSFYWVTFDFRLWTEGGRAAFLICTLMTQMFISIHLSLVKMMEL